MLYGIICSSLIGFWTNSLGRFIVNFVKYKNFNVFNNKLLVSSKKSCVVFYSYI